MAVGVAEVAEATATECLDLVAVTRVEEAVDEEGLVVESEEETAKCSCCL